MASWTGAGEEGAGEGVTVTVEIIVTGGGDVFAAGAEGMLVGTSTGGAAEDGMLVGISTGGTAEDGTTGGRETWLVASWTTEELEAGATGTETIGVEDGTTMGAEDGITTGADVGTIGIKVVLMD